MLKAKTRDEPAVIGNRYLVEKLLGRGGMAVVYQVFDSATQRKLALKQLIKSRESKKSNDIADLFEHEFHVLSELAHPRVIEVYDFGVEEGRCYYTMELLDGGDLRELSPLPWNEVCSYLRDVCSALSLLHSRRQIHGDLTPRNIRRSRDGKAKLIDFGAMVPMGHCKFVIGTPPFAAPETLNSLALDARTDLYSVGATAFFALTGRNAYPARNFRELRYLWRNQPLPPSSFVEDIPKELDNLVMSLINLDNMARPGSAAEVIEKLSAIASLEVDESLFISKAYLSAPTLVGRDKDLLRIRKRMFKTLQGRGGTLMIEGASGVGCSRLLDACVLEGKLAGAAVLRADASDSHSGNWGAVRAIASQLLETLPELAIETAKPHVSILGHIVPELVTKTEDALATTPIAQCEGVWARIPSIIPPRMPIDLIETPGNEDRDKEKDGHDEPKSFVNTFSAWTEVWGRHDSWQPPSRLPSPVGDQKVLETFGTPQHMRSRLQGALCDWLLQVSSRQLLMIAVDDIHQIDEPSAAFFAVLANEIEKRKIVLAVTLATDAPAISSRATKLLRDTSHEFVLNNLDAENTEKLLSSMFGDVPNLKSFSGQLFRLSHGNPRTIIQMTQHTIDRGIVTYHAGVWALPSTLDTSDLPASLSEALITRVNGLSPAARQLAQTVALSPDKSFAFDDYLVLVEDSNPRKAIQLLDELVAAEILTTDGHYYAFNQQGWISILKERLDANSARSLHLKLARAFEKRGNEEVRVASHLLRAGWREEGLKKLIAISRVYQEAFLRGVESISETIVSLPLDWIETYESALQIGKELNIPVKDSFLLETVLVNLGSNEGKVSATHLRSLVAQLYRESGLSIYDEIGGQVEESARLVRALEIAQSRYDSLAESARIYPPAEAIRDLAYKIVMAIGYSGGTFDYPFLESMPSLKPFVPLSPALDIIVKNVENTTLMISDRHDDARQGFIEILNRLAESDRAGLEGTVYAYTVLSIKYALGMIEAGMGTESALRWAEEIEHDPLFQVNAWRVRMISYLFRGDIKQADRCKKRMELLQLQSSPNQLYEGAHLFLELLAYCGADDLIGTKQIVPRLRQMAQQYITWEPIVGFAEGEYDRIRGDYQKSLLQFEKALSAIEPGRHVLWPYATAAYLRVLFELERFDEVKQLAPRYLEQAEAVKLGSAATYIKMPYALTQAVLGDHQSAIRNAQDMIDTYTKLGSSGLTLGLIYEARARVAIYMGDLENLKIYARLCAEQYRTGHNPTLRAKYEKLLQEANYAGMNMSTNLERAAEMSNEISDRLLEQTTSSLSQCSNVKEQMRRLLEILVKHSNSNGGFLFTMRGNGPTLVAEMGEEGCSDRINNMVKEYIAAEINTDGDVTKTNVESEASAAFSTLWADRQGIVFQPLLLGHNTGRGFAITGVAVLRLNPEKMFEYPASLVVTLSHYLFDSENVLPMYTST
jgi:hypothetical protein